jgi:DNA polymerase I-like protein with 3'-5' exonuclease and polymerase domains
LWDWQAKEIDRQGIQDIVNFERRLMPTIIRAETKGIRVDLAYAEEAADKITPLINEMQARINKLAGWEFNTNSPPQTKEYFQPTERNGEFFVGNAMIGKTPGGNASLGADYLRIIEDPMAAMILEIRSMIKTRDTFLRGHVLSHNYNGRVYPNVNQNKGEDGGTGPGRLSYSGPAMQQIPSRNKKVAALVKPCFLPEEGQKWVDIDEASFEVRVFAHLVNNPTIVQAYRDKPSLDFHQFVADLTNLPRNATYGGEANAKQLNLSMIFNSGNGAIADKMGMPWEWNSFLPRGKEDKPENWITYKKAGEEALNVIAKYHHRVPGVQDLADGCKATAERRGHIFTRLGRRLRFPNGYKCYKASGLLIQATAADINKENWMTIEETLQGRGHLMLNTHDSYSMSLPEDWKPIYKEVKAELEKPKLRVPLLVDLNGVGDNWWQALQGE